MLHNEYGSMGFPPKRTLHTHHAADQPFLFYFAFFSLLLLLRLGDVFIVIIVVACRPPTIAATGNDYGAVKVVGVRVSARNSRSCICQTDPYVCKAAAVT